MDKGIIELINKIPGWENKMPYQGAFAVKPFGRMAGRPVKCVVPGKDKVSVSYTHLTLPTTSRV